MKQVFIGTLFAVSLMACHSEAEIAVRHSGTSENEFQALAQALGFTTVTEVLSEKNAPATDVSELFRLRLVEAQSEWLKKGKSFNSIDRFLELELEADWTPSERQAFVIFFSRRLDSELSSAKEQELLTRLSAFTAGDDTANLSAMTAKVKLKWEAFLAGEETDQKTRHSFPTNLPTDVSVVLLNGRPFSRQRLSSMPLPRAEVRVTLLSNVYQPFTVRMSDRTTDWPTVSRKAWINEDCSINALPPSYGEVTMKVLGFAGCEGVKSESVAENHLAKFGLSQRSPMSDELPSSNGTAVLKKPWFWGALGVLALGAVLAVRANDNREAAVQPTNNEGW